MQRALHHSETGGSEATCYIRTGASDDHQEETLESRVEEASLCLQDEHAVQQVPSGLSYLHLGGLSESSYQNRANAKTTGGRLW